MGKDLFGRTTNHMIYYWIWQYLEHSLSMEYLQYTKLCTTWCKSEQAKI